MPCKVLGREVDDFTYAYLKCAVWLLSEDDRKQFPEIANLSYDERIRRLSNETLKDAIEDCTAFWEEHGDILISDMERAGHDFYLSRNRHGAGFWDGDWGDDGDKLHEAAKVYSTWELYVGDDKRIYHHG